MTFTVHFVNANFEFQSKILSTISVPENHSTLNLKICIVEIITNWRLMGKVAYVGGAHIVKAVADAGLCHVRCFAHTLNPVVKGAIEKTTLSTTVPKMS